MCVEEKTSDSRNKKSTFILSVLYATIKSILHTLFFFYKNIFYKNIEAEICEILRIF